MKKMAGLLSAVLIVSILLTGCVGKVTEREKAEKEITALMKSFTETYFKEPNAFVALFNYPLEVLVKRGTGAVPYETEVFDNAADFAALLEKADWNGEIKFTLHSIAEINIDDAYKNAVASVEIKLEHFDPPETQTYDFELVNVKGEWLIAKYTFLVMVDPDK